jgi:hypothetical protein
LTQDQIDLLIKEAVKINGLGGENSDENLQVEMIIKRLR